MMQTEIESYDWGIYPSHADMVKLPTGQLWLMLATCEMDEYAELILNEIDLRGERWN